MKSIKSKINFNFLIVIVFTVLVLEALFTIFLQKYYYDNTESVLLNQIKVSADFYKKYFSDTSLLDNITDNIDVFWNQTTAQVQIIDKNGKLLMDSIGVKDSNYVETSDVKKALRGQNGRWIGKVNYSDYSVMAVSYPLTDGENVIGVLRYITSLKDVNEAIASMTAIFLAIGVIVLFIGAILSYILANSIVNPIKELTIVAERMAQGDLQVRSKNKTKDELGRLSLTLDYMAEELYKREQLKNEFISSVSHELRTPLTAIKGWVVILNSDETDKEMLKTGFEIIEKETDRLTNMVEELLDFSRLVSGKIILNFREVDLEALINYIGVYLRPRAERDNILFDIEIDENLPTIEGDIDRLKQVLINILDNAFKFTEDNGKVRLSVYKEYEYVKIVIKDNGCGISEEELPRVKEKFYKGKNSKSQNGIGLSICDEIVRLHNGILDIRSEENVGTEVIITLPQKPL